MRHRPFVLGLAVALVMLLTLTTAAFADGPTTDTAKPPEPPKAKVCVDGYVINHREVPVDGLKAGLQVEAVRGKQENDVVDPNAAATDELAAVQTAPVGADGYFKFEKLTEGKWNFRLALPAEWEGIVPVDTEGVAEMGMTSFVEQKGCHRIVFKIRRVFQITVIKYLEGLDGNVTRGEGWEITATPVNDPFVKAQTKKTDANGEATFKLTAGKWIISEKVKPGYKPVTPPQLTLTLDQYSDSGARLPVVFKNKVPPCYATLDVYKIGHDAGGEPLGPLGGWKVTLTRADGTMIAVTGVTDAEGHVKFTKLAPGVYKITETLQPGWKLMTDLTLDDGTTVANKNPFVVTLASCDPIPPVAFHNQETRGKLTIYGKKLYKAWVPPLKGQILGLAQWKITATLVGTETSIDVMTDAHGNYVFTEDALTAAGIAFPGASVKVCEELRPNWIAVTPKCVTVKFPYPVPEDYKGIQVNFTNIQDPPLPGADSGAPAAAGAAGCTVYHQVVSGDTLAKIAGHYGTSMGGIIRANGIRNADVIYLGQKLCIP